MSKTALITGITGMVGSHLLDFLLENTDWVIHGLVRWRSPLDNICHRIEAVNSAKRIFLHTGDITDYESLESIFQVHSFDYIFHLAAQSFPKTSFSSSNNTYDVNIIGTNNVLRACRAYCHNSIIHNCSSSEVFGRVPREFVPINEETPFIQLLLTLFLNVQLI